MTLRIALTLGVVAVAAAVASWLLFRSSGESGSTAAGNPVVVPATRAPVAPTGPGLRVKGTSCRDHRLAYGVTDDRAAAQQFDADFRSPLVPHPPIPAGGYYPPGDPVSSTYTLIHALYHGYAVVRYRPQQADRVHRTLAPAVGDSAILVAGSDSQPWAFGAVVYGHQLTCGKLGGPEARALVRWLGDH